MLTGISCIGLSCIVGGLFLILTNSETNQMERFNSITFDMSYEDVCNVMGSQGVLVSEKKGYLNQATYIWYLGWHIVRKGHSSIYNNGNGYIYSNNKERTYIKIMFENNKVVSKEHSGLGL